MNLAVIIDAEVLRCRYGGNLHAVKPLVRTADYFSLSSSDEFVYIDKYIIRFIYKRNGGKNK